MKKQLFLLFVAILIFASSIISVHAANPYSLKSQGCIVFTNATEDSSDDVIFDASDFVTLANKCK